MRKNQHSPLFIVFDSPQGHLYGHLLASGPQDPFLAQIVDWWTSQNSARPLGLDYPWLPQDQRGTLTLSPN